MEAVQQLDGPSVVIGILVGIVMVLLWSGVWFVWDSLADWLRRGDAELQTHIDEALANSREREVLR